MPPAPPHAHSPWAAFPSPCPAAVAGPCCVCCGHCPLQEEGYGPLGLLVTPVCPSKQVSKVVGKYSLAKT